MQIIKKFSPQSDGIVPIGLKSLKRDGSEHWTVDDTLIPVGDSSGVVRLPILNPTLARYTSLQSLPSARIALFSPQHQSYLRSTGTDWEEVGQPQYQEIELIRPALNRWVGPMQIEIEVTENWQAIWVAYEVNVDLLFYLIKFAIPSKLQQEQILVSRRGYTDRDGRFKIEGIDSSLIKWISARLMGQFFEPCLISDSTIHLETPNSPVEVWCRVSPQVEAAYHLYQAEKIPCCVLRLLREENIRYPQGEESIQLSRSESLFMRSGYVADLPIEAKIIAVEEEDGRAIAAGLIAALQRDGRIYVPPFDLSFAAWANGQIQLTPGIPPTYTFRFTVKNVPGSTLSEIRTTAKNYYIKTPQPGKLIVLNDSPVAIASADDLVP